MFTKIRLVEAKLFRADGRTDRNTDWRTDTQTNRQRGRYDRGNSSFWQFCKLA